eukprot:1592076-Pyramimonas_sp.AAC.1
MGIEADAMMRACVSRSLILAFAVSKSTDMYARSFVRAPVSSTRSSLRFASSSLTCRATNQVVTNQVLSPQRVLTILSTRARVHRSSS